ncbi:MAG: tyrosine-protein phosphatase [Acidobacteriota bacterium]
MTQRSIPKFFHYGGLALALFLLTVVSAGVPTRTSSVPGVSIKNFGKVNEHYYRGSQPRHEEVEQLKKLGIKTVIDLRKDSERAEADWVRGAGLQYFNLLMKSSTAATEEQTTHFLKLVNDPANWPVYVHCKGGRHRTGALTAVYRITHDGWTADQAFREMQEYDFDNGLFGGPGAQKKFVYAFYERHLAASAGGQK